MFSDKVTDEKIFLCFKKFIDCERSGASNAAIRTQGKANLLPGQGFDRRPVQYLDEASPRAYQLPLREIP